MMNSYNDLKQMFPSLTDADIQTFFSSPDQFSVVGSNNPATGATGLSPNIDLAGGSLAKSLTQSATPPELKLPPPTPPPTDKVKVGVGSMNTTSEKEEPWNLTDFTSDQAKRDELAASQPGANSWKTLLPRIIAGFGDAVANAVKVGYKVNMSTDALKDVMVIQNKVKQSEKDELEKKFLTDPTSGISRQYQTIFAEYINRKPTDPIISKMSASEISSQLPAVEKKAQMDLQREMKELEAFYRKSMVELGKDSRDENRNLRRDQAILNYSEKLENNPTIKEMRKQNIAMGTIGELVNAVKNGNTIAANAIGAKMARGMGEVGVLTDQDVKRYVQSGWLPQAIGDKVMRLMKGKPTDMTLDEIAQVTKVIQTRYDEQIKPIEDIYVHRLATNFGMSNEEAADKLGVGMPRDMKQKQTTIIRATNPKTNQKIQSSDGGKTWQSAQ